MGAAAGLDRRIEERTGCNQHVVWRAESAAQAYMQHTPTAAPAGAGLTGTFPPTGTPLARHERSDPLMDQEPTSVASATESSSARTSAAEDDRPTTPRRRSDWGKVQVKKPAEREETPKTERPPGAPKTERASAPAKTAAPKAQEPATTPSADRPGDGDVATPAGNGSGAPRRRRRGGRGRGGKKPASAQTTGTTDDTSGTASAETDGASDRAPEKPRQPQLKKPTETKEPAQKPARKPAKTPDTEPAPEASGDAEEKTDGASKKRRRRGGRGRGGKKTATTTETEVAETAETQRDDATPDADQSAKKKPSRRRSTAKKKSETAPPEAPAKKKSKSKPKTLEEQVAAGGPTRGIRTSRTRTGRDGRRRREPVAPPPRVSDKLMAITEHGERDQIAVLEEDVLVQHYVTRAGATSMVGNVYLGRVQNVLPGMEAAFVDIGRGRNGVLYAGEVNYSPEDIDGPAPRIEQLLKPGQAVMVQVTKDPMGGKGARLTANLSLAGRYLVLAPNQNLQGISRRLGDDARKRLKAMLKRVKPPEHGVIVRTAAEGATEEALEADLRRLLAIWDDIQKKAKKGKAPTVLYEEPELTVRVVRDLFTDEEFRELVTDSRRVYDKIHAYLAEVAPDLAQKITLHEGALPAFEEHRIVEQIHKALDKKVWLPSGGYLFIERTEAMTIIDVNTGKSVGKTNLEETVVNTNLEAAREVARQLRLRDIGGIIVIDFIDMLLEKNKKQVEDTMREALAIDKTRSQVFEIGPLGLMQVTRKRVSSGLVESFSETCPTCEGRGIILTYDVD
jgi:ribonuclease E